MTGGSLEIKILTILLKQIDNCRKADISLFSNSRQKDEIVPNMTDVIAP